MLVYFYLKGHTNMKRTVSIFVALFVFCVSSALYCNASADFYGFDDVSTHNLMGMTNYNVSIYGDDLEANMVVTSPVINQFRISDNTALVNGFVDSDDNDTSFCLKARSIRHIMDILYLT